jgi:NtrC-family two-component system response regulator AlgB
MTFARFELPVAIRRATVRVLVVGAHDTGGSLVRALTSLGCVVQWVASGSAAVEALQRGRFDLAFHDVQAGDAWGLDLLPILLSHAPDLRVVVTTDRPDCPEAVGALRRGAADYLTAPLTLSRLRHLVEDELERMAPAADVLPLEWALPWGSRDERWKATAPSPSAVNVSTSFASAKAS